MIKPKHILVLRFSALGDIAMTVPVIKNVLHQNPNLKITYVSIPQVEPLFLNIEKLHFFSVDLKKTKGIFALVRLARLLKNTISYDAVADLHDVLRSKIIRFILRKKSVAIIDKGRKEKQALVRLHDKVLQPIKPMFERYADVFRKLGLSVSLNIEQGITVQKSDEYLLPFPRKDNYFIGIAPFAKHTAKLYPLEKMRQVIYMLAKIENNKILIFGAKEETIVFMDLFANSNVVNMAGQFKLSEELNLISKLDVMITMDSANMHFASLVGTPVISIWGGTHPFAGFYGWGQDQDNIMQTDLPCRPSSIFGNKVCPIHVEAGCMQEITPEMVFEKVMSLLI